MESHHRTLGGDESRESKMMPRQINWIRWKDVCRSLRMARHASGPAACGPQRWAAAGHPGGMR